ncbi:unnamed protein product, partial [marine sediment metagenome]
MSEIEEIPIKKIKVGEYDQRLGVDDEKIAELASSIARVGLLYPVIVRKDGDNYMMIEGHRRMCAHMRLGMEVIKAIVTQSGKEFTAEMAFAGNFFRSNLSPIELAAALNDCLTNEVMTIDELAAGFNKSKHWVSSMIAIAGWPADVQEAIHHEKLSVSAASNLALVTDDSYRRFLVRNAVEQGATART